LRHKKREETFALKRQVGTARTAPILVAVIALTQNADPIVVREKLVKSDADSVVTHSGQGFVHLRYFVKQTHFYSNTVPVFYFSVPRLKQRFSIYAPQPDNLTAALDVLKVADSVVFVLSAENDFINDDGECLLQAAFSQGLPTPVLVATDLADLPIKVGSINSAFVFWLQYY
jgi:pre-rRNA-processing protein TSR1